MTTVICKLCEHQKNEEDCWCVIDTKTKERFFECKKTCILPAKLSPPGLIAEDWADAYPKESWFQRIQSWFSRPSAYIKVKSS